MQKRQVAKLGELRKVKCLQHQQCLKDCLKNRIKVGKSDQAVESFLKSQKLPVT